MQRYAYNIGHMLLSHDLSSAVLLWLVSTRLMVEHPSKIQKVKGSAPAFKHSDFSEFPRVRIRTSDRKVIGSAPSFEHSDFSEFPRASIRISNHKVISSPTSFEHWDFSEFPQVSIRTSNRKVTGSALSLENSDFSLTSLETKLENSIPKTF